MRYQHKAMRRSGLRTRAVTRTSYSVEREFALSDNGDITDFAHHPGASFHRLFRDIQGSRHLPTRILLGT